ncbi:MAG: cation diffusion facilitator family transporter [Pseudomonadota bacterium]
MHEKRTSSRKALLAAFFVTVSFLVLEFVFAFITNSLALLADAGHMLGDSSALGMAVWASFMAEKHADMKKSYGYGRAEVLVALLNALLLFAIAGYTFYRAVGRIAAPEDVAGRGMLIVAVAGLAANIVSGTILLKQARHNINIRAALFHVAGDALGSVGVLVAALIILLTGWMIADPIVSMVICLLIVAGAVRLFLESWHILMEGVPGGFSQDEAQKLLCSIEDVVSVHDIHAWAITSGKYAATAHLVIKDDGSASRVRQQAAGLFKKKWNIHHVTLQVVPVSDPSACPRAACCRIDELDDRDVHGGHHGHGHHH